jgi:drug/metabolite transporter (DMT)-like permease
MLLFVGSGIIDTSLKYIEEQFVPVEEVAVFSGSLFAIAAFFGSVLLGIKALKKRDSFGFKNIIAGIILGVPNYYSIVFLIKALQTDGFESSTLFTLNNVAIVIVSSIVGLILFRERFSNNNKIGVFLAIIGIILVSLA